MPRRVIGLNFNVGPSMDPKKSWTVRIHHHFWWWGPLFCKASPTPKKRQQAHRPGGVVGLCPQTTSPYLHKKTIEFFPSSASAVCPLHCPHSINVLFFLSFLNNIRIRIQGYKKTKHAWGHARNHPLPRQHVHSCSGRGLSNQFPTST